jgi:hypothetical protein
MQQEESSFIKRRLMFVSKNQGSIPDCGGGMV